MLADLTQPTVAAPNLVNSPSHYTTGKIEVIDFIEDQRLNWRCGNIIKYVCRAPHKGAQLQDLKKARWYLDREIAKLSEVSAQGAL